MELFWSFFKIGLFTFGGGYAMIPIIQNEVIRRRGWIEERDFLDLLTLAQSAPGPIYVGIRRIQALRIPRCRDGFGGGCAAGIHGDTSGGGILRLGAS